MRSQREAKQDAPANLIYIAGSGRSGSTLLDRLLDRHPQIVGTGEVHRLTLDPRQRRCACGETLTECSFWRRIVSESLSVNQDALLTGWPEDFRVSGRLAPRATKRRIPTVLDVALVVGSAHILRLLAAVHAESSHHLSAMRTSWSLYDTITDVTDATTVVDSTKNAGRMKSLYMLRPNSTKILHLVRDGRAVASSARRRTGVKISKGAEEWSAANRNVEVALTTVPDRDIRRVRYEDLCSDPKATLRKLCAFVGLHYTDALIESSSGAFHQIPGNPMLHSSGPLRIIPDYEWRDEFSTADQLEFDRVAGRRNRSYGYT